jgi:hypothetical protein
MKPAVNETAALPSVMDPWVQGSWGAAHTMVRPFWGSAQTAPLLRPRRLLTLATMLGDAMAIHGRMRRSTTQVMGQLTKRRWMCCCSGALSIFPPG